MAARTSIIGSSLTAGMRNEPYVLSAHCSSSASDLGRVSAMTGGTHRKASSSTHRPVLAVVAVEVDVVESVVRGPVDVVLEARVADHVGVVDEDAPEVDESEESNEQVLVDRADVHAQVIRDRLRVPVHGVERVRRKWAGD